MNKEEELIDRLIDLSFAEDIGDGDHTTLSCIPATAMGKSKLLIKEAGILAGIEIAKEVFKSKLKTIYHTRVQYPDEAKKAEEAATQG